MRPLRRQCAGRSRRRWRTRRRCSRRRGANDLRDLFRGGAWDVRRRRGRRDDEALLAHDGIEPEQEASRLARRGRPARPRQGPLRGVGGRSRITHDPKAEKRDPLEVRFERVIGGRGLHVRTAGAADRRTAGPYPVHERASCGTAPMRHRRTSTPAPGEWNTLAWRIVRQNSRRRQQGGFVNDSVIWKSYTTTAIRGRFL